MALLQKQEKEEEKCKNTVMWILAIIGAVAAVAGIAYAVYRFFTPDYLGIPRHFVFLNLCHIHHISNRYPILQFSLCQTSISLKAPFHRFQLLSVILLLKLNLLQTFPIIILGHFKEFQIFRRLASSFLQSPIPVYFSFPLPVFPY